MSSDSSSRLANLLQDLNPQQRAIVETVEPYVLVLAGAGSGKTRVLIHRIAWLIENQGIFPSQIIAATFSNKAAQEMQHRLKGLLPLESVPNWIGTFHGLSHRILRSHSAETGLPNHFQILDGEDQLRLVKRLLKEANLDPTSWPPKRVLYFIQKQKDRGSPPKTGMDSASPQEKIFQSLYAEYQRTCARAHLLDFTDLILRTLHLWNSYPAVLEKYQRKFHTILVDEFQDTDTLQYLWLKTLAGQALSIMAVGDDDQCIYGWRGAQIKNLFEFSKDLKNVEILRLEQNYRSSPEILKAANALIGHNQQRFGKNLWSAAPSGEKILLYVAPSELDEAYFVAETIYRLSQQQVPLSQVAILYRTNAQSRVIEEALLRLQLPYKIYGGTRFFDRQEIKDALAYLRLLLNLDDDDAFERILNFPARGIGEKTIEGLRKISQEQSCSLWIALQRLLQSPIGTARKCESLRNFSNLILTLEQLCADKSLSEMLRMILDQTGLRQHYDRAQHQDPFGFNNRLENLFELLNAAHYFEMQESVESSEAPSSKEVASKFLTHAALDQAHLHSETIQEQKLTSQKESVHLMTLHAVKGLEFEYVFIVGWEEGLFPSDLSQDIFERIEEERRLAYVGLTRARRFLYLSRAERRNWHGRLCRNLPSRFLSELPKELIKTSFDDSSDSVKKSVFPMYPEILPEKLSKALLPGRCVRHQKFGEGLVTEIQGSGPQLKIRVKFSEGHDKWFLATMAKLEPMP